MLSLHEVKIHKVYNFLYIYAIFIIAFTFIQLWVPDTVASCIMISLEDESSARQHKEKNLSGERKIRYFTQIPAE